jgi:zinc transport system substrate-binding protein
VRIVINWGNVVRKIKVVSSILCILAILMSGVFFVLHFAQKHSEAKIVVTAFPIYDIVTNIIGDSEDVILLSSGTDLHSYEPTPADIKTISQSQLFITIGGESWVDETLDRIDNPNMVFSCLMDSVELLPLGGDGIVEDNHHEEEHHNHDHSQYDEHIWLSINNMMIMAQEVYDNLIVAYPHMQSIYYDNFNNYIQQLKQLESEYSRALVSKITPIIVADRFPFIYLTNDYNIKYYAAFSGCSTDTEASFDTIMQLIDRVDSTDVDYIFILENTTHKIADSIITGCKKGRNITKLELNSCQNIGHGSYIDIMYKNLENLKKAIQS